MIVLAAIPLVGAVALGLCSDRLARELTPSDAVRWLTALALSIALCTGLVLSAMAVLVLVQTGPWPGIGHWSAATLRHEIGFPAAVGYVAAGVVGLCLSAAFVRAARSIHALRQAGRAARTLLPTLGNVVVVDDEIPVAYSVSGRPGRIVVSTSMLAALSSDERPVLLAHEASHLRHRHHLYFHLAQLAAAANPLLRPTASAIERAIERWADEDAATEVGDRGLAAHTLARAALARTGRPPVRYGLAGADTRVAERVARLLAPPPRRRLAFPLAVIGVAVVGWAAAIAIAFWSSGLIQVAESVYERR